MELLHKEEKNMRNTTNVAVNHAVDECIKEGILAEFLKANKTEVIAVSIFEYDKEEEEKKLRKAEYEAGREDGEREGRIAGEKIGLENGMKLGKNQGIQSMILSFLTDYGTVPEELKNYILKEQNAEKLCQWIKLAARVGSVDEFWKKII